jgi:uncharacterized protein YdeI (BOF family)
MKKTSSGVPKVVIGVTAVMILAGIVAGLAYGFFNRHVRIGSILKDPTTFHGQQVVVNGRVTGRLSIGAFGMYYLEDGTGKIRVQVDGSSLPGVGEKVTVKGNVNNTFKIGALTVWTVIEEKQRW